MTEGGQKLVNRYKAWCRGTQGVDGDCLGGALVGGKYLDLQGRYMLAMALSKSPVLEEFQRALGEMVSMRAVLQAAIGTPVTLLVLLALPEPVTKFVAAWATAALVLWVGASTLYDHHIGTNANNISTARGAVDTETQEALCQGWDALRGHGECRADRGAQGASSGGVP